MSFYMTCLKLPIATMHESIYFSDFSDTHFANCSSYSMSDGSISGNMAVFILTSSAGLRAGSKGYTLKLHPFLSHRKHFLFFFNCSILSRVFNLARPRCKFSLSTPVKLIPSLIVSPKESNSSALQYSSPIRGNPFWNSCNNASGTLNLSLSNFPLRNSDWTDCFRRRFRTSSTSSCYVTCPKFLTHSSKSSSGWK